MSLQKYQWTMSGMRADDSEHGAMWLYRGMDVDQELQRRDEEIAALQAEVKTLGDGLTLLKEYPPLKRCHEHIRLALDWLRDEYPARQTFPERELEQALKEET